MAIKTIELQFHNFKVIEDLGMRFVTEKSKQKRRIVKVECMDCGEKQQGQITHFQSRAKVCPCNKIKEQNDVSFYIGKVFNKFKIVSSFAREEATTNSKQKKRYFLGECVECGGKRKAPISILKTDVAVCFFCKEELAKKVKSLKRLHRIYHGMKSRCMNPNTGNYHYYGNKGITICSEWLDSKEDFYKWALNNGYQEHLTIDRINSDLGYSPNNCRWVSQEEQVRNRDVCLSIDEVKEIKGHLSKGICINEIMDITHISYDRINDIKRNKTWIEV